MFAKLSIYFIRKYRVFFPKNNKPFTTFLLPALSGTLLFLSFPDYPFNFLAWIALIPFFISIQDTSPKTAFFRGWWTGFFYFLGTLYWVTHSMIFYGKLSPWLSILLMLILVAYLSIYVATFASLTRWILIKNRIPFIFLAPFFWVALEYARAHLLSGFPWVLLGYSQHQSLTLIQISDITSVYGVSFLIVLVNVFIYVCVLPRLKYPKKIIKTNFPRLTATYTLIVLMMTLSYGWIKLTPSSEKNVQKPITLSVIQGNIGQDIKWDPTFQEETYSIYKKLTHKETSRKTDLVIWPEAATPFLFNQDLPRQKEILQLAEVVNTPILLGSPSISSDNQGRPVLQNSAYLISSSGTIEGQYHKIHLVPFGEYVPFSSFLSFIHKMVEGIGDFLPGDSYSTMKLGQVKFGVVICFEVIFPELVRKFVEKGAKFMVTITNDAWFGETSAPYQHFSMVVFRAIENRVPFARAANTGISGFIDAQGKILKKSTLFEETTLRETLYPNYEPTFYTKHGDLFAILCVIMSSFLIILNFILPSKQKGP